MVYAENLAARVRAAIAGKGSVEEKMAFGGLTFMMDDKMCVGVEKARLIVRIDPARHEELAKRPGASPMELARRPMKGFLFVDAKALPDAAALGFWVDTSVSYVRTVPVKKRKESAAAAKPRAPAKDDKRRA